MADEKLILEIRLDEKGIAQDFKKIEAAAGQTTKNIKGTIGNANTGALSGLSDNLSEVALRFGAVSAAAISFGLAIKKGFDFVLLGEGAKSVENNFKNLANSAGLAADELKTAINIETKGLIDTGDALQIATTSIIALGENAKSLPQILELARNTSSLLGRDFKETFGNLSTFVESGNAKILKQYGILIDTKGALDAYAKSVGLTADKLTTQQEQAIRANLLLEQTAKTFSKTGESSKPLSESIDRLTVSLKNLSEDASKNLDSNLSPALTRIVNGFTELTNKGVSLSQALFFLQNPIAGTAGFLINAAQAADDFSNVGLRELESKAKDAELSLAKLNEKLAEYKRLGLEKSNPIVVESTLKDINDQTEALKRFNFEINSRKGSEVDAVAFAERPKAAPIPDLTAEQLKAISDVRKQNELSLTQFLTQQNLARLQSDLETINANDSFAQQRASALLLEQQNLEILEVAHKQKLLDIENQFSTTKGFTLAQQKLAEDSLIATNAAQRISIEEDTANKILEIRKKEAEQTQIFTQYTADNFAKVALEAKKTLAVGVGNAFSKFGQALGRGEDASAAFAEAISGALAQAAADLGNFFIQSGIGRIAVSYGADASGYAMLAAGIALNALSGFLGGAKSSSSGSSETGGGIASSPSDITAITPEEKLTRAEDRTRVEVTIQGSIYDSSETGSRIVELINNAFNEKGVVVNAGAVA